MSKSRQWKAPDEMKWDVWGFGDEYVQYCSGRTYLLELFTSQRNQFHISSANSQVKLCHKYNIYNETPSCSKACMQICRTLWRGSKTQTLQQKALMSHDIWKGLLYVWRKPTDTYNSRRLFPTVKSFFFFWC